MMSSEEIEELVRQLRYTPDESTEQRLYSPIEAAWGQHEHKQRTSTRSIWRFITGGKVAKPAAAAAILIGVLLVLHYFTGSMDVTTPAFAEVVENTLSQKWVYMFEEDRKDGQIVAEYWYNPSEQKLYAKGHGGALVLDMDSGEKYEYRNNQISIDKMDNLEYYFARIAERMPMLDGLLNRHEREGADIVQKASLYNSQPALLYEIEMTLPDGQALRTDRYSWLVDKKTHLPIICEYTHLLYLSGKHNKGFRQIGVQNSRRYAFDYPDSGPSDIYDLGVPVDANVVDARPDPESEIQQLIDKINHIKETKYNSYAVIIKERDRPQERIIRDGRNVRVEHLELKINGSDFEPKKEQYRQAMGETFGSVDQWINESDIMRCQLVIICDGQFNYKTHDGDIEDNQPVEMSRHSTYGDSFFPYYWRSMPGGKIVVTPYAEKNNLICTEKGERKYYYDPTRNYMCVRVETKEGRVHEEILEFGQTPAGMCYPSKISKGYYSRKTGSDELIPRSEIVHIYAEDVNDELRARLDPRSLPNYVDHRELTRQMKARRQTAQNSVLTEYTGFTPLHMAIYRQDIERVKRLLKKGAEAEPAYDSGATPMELAVASGNLEMVKLLQKHGADFISNDSEQRDALGLAVKEGYQEMAKFMLANGSDVDAFYKEQDRPLKYAAANGDIEMVKMLLQHSPQIDPRDSEGRTPLYSAIDSLNEEMHGSRPVNNETVQQYEQVVALLIENGADINSRDESGQTVLLRTIFLFSFFGQNMDQKFEHVRFLIRMGANPNLASENVSPLFRAAQEGQYDMVRVLLKGGADPWLAPSGHYAYHHHNMLHFARRTRADNLYDVLYPYMKDRYEQTNKKLIDLTKQVVGACLAGDMNTLSTICADHPSYSRPWNGWSKKMRDFYQGHENLLEKTIPGWFTLDGVAETYIPLPEGTAKKSIMLGFIQYPDGRWKCIYYREQNDMPAFEQASGVSYALQHELEDFRNLMYEDAGLPEKITKKGSGASTLHGKFEGQLILTVQHGNLRVDFEEENWRKRYILLTLDCIKMYQGTGLRVYSGEYIQKQKDYAQQVIYHPLELIVDTGDTKYVFTVSDGRVLLTQAAQKTKAERFIFDLGTWELRTRKEMNSGFMTYWDR